MAGMSQDHILAHYGAINSAGDGLRAEHRLLDQMTQDLNTQLKKATWVSQSQENFRQIMAKYNVHMAELHDELNRLAQALIEAGINLQAADKNASKLFLNQ
jgi:uncharacterized protein YukE